MFARGNERPSKTGGFDSYEYSTAYGWIGTLARARETMFREGRIKSPRHRTRVLAHTIHATPPFDGQLGTSDVCPTVLATTDKWNGHFEHAGHDVGIEPVDDRTESSLDGGIREK